MYKYVDTGIYVTEEKAVKAYIGEFKFFGSKYSYKNCKTMDELVEKVTENNDEIADELLTNDDGLFRVIEYTEELDDDGDRTFTTYEDGKLLDTFTELTDDNGYCDYDFNDFCRDTYPHSILE